VNRLARRVTRRSLAALTSLLLALGCAASTTGSKSADSAGEDNDPGSSSYDDDDEFDGSVESGEGPVDSPESQCADGSCAVCGEGLCPAGFYCDESGAEPGCAWLPQCASSNDCACLEKHLTGCSCREESGGVYLTCE